MAIDDVKIQGGPVVRVLVWLQYVAYLLLGVQFVFYLSIGDSQHAMYTFLSFPVILLPLFIVRSYDIRVPAWFVPVVTVFAFLAQFLGSTLGFYLRYGWWDDILHSTWGVLSVVLGFVLLQFLDQATVQILRRKALFLTLFAFSFSLMTSVIWEIAEFIFDRIFGANSQQGGWPDTMIDLTTSTIGALVLAVSSYLWMRAHHRIPFVPIDHHER